MKYLVVRLEVEGKTSQKISLRGGFGGIHVIFKNMPYLNIKNVPVHASKAKLSKSK